MSVVISDPAGTDWEAASEHRTRGISIKPLIHRDGEGRSFEFNVVRFGGEDFFSPRHRHNFDQIRIGLEGTTNYGKADRLRPRMIGYYPESTWYGPLSVNEPSVQAILQFDGASRCGYVYYVELDKATEELRAEGTFGGGFYEPNDGGKKVDGYQASWERATGREMIYPTPRFKDPFYLDLDAFAWVESPESPVASKTLGVFGERHLTMEMLRVPAGASVEVGVPDRTVIVFVLTGRVSTPEGELSQWGAAMAEEQAVALTGSADESELIVFGLPAYEGQPLSRLSRAV